MKYLPRIEFNNTSLKAQKLQSKLLDRISHVIDSGIFLEGPENERLKKKLTTYFSVRYIQTVASGHDAIVFALLSLGIKRGDQVLCPANAYPTAFAIVQTGACLELVDVDENGQMNPSDLSKRLSKKIKAIVVVHMYGHVGNLGTIKHLAKQHSIPLIEDCAQSYGAEYRQEKVGMLGDIGCFSFYPTKNFGTLGDGGAVVTKSKKIYDYITAAKSYGEKQKYLSLFPSSHSRLPEIQAAVLNTYWPTLSKELSTRRSLLKLIEACVFSAGLSDSIRVITSVKEANPAPHLFVVITSKRDKLQSYLKKKGIPTFIHYPKPIHQVPAFNSQNEAPRRKRRGITRLT